MTKTITLEPITRIEGHARITMDVEDNGSVTGARLHVLEIRGFEKLLENMELRKMPMVTARICGVCPAAHHLAAAIAIEQGAKITIPKRAQDLRELMYLGHILHSHALSCFVLTGPDLLAGIGANPKEKNIFSLLTSSPEAAKKMLRLRSIGQKIVEIVGGRGVHPITVIPGGIASQPSAEEMQKIGEWGKESLTLIEELYPIMAEALSKIADVREAMCLDSFPMALSLGGTVSFLQGNCAVTDASGKISDAFATANYADHLIEHVMPGSYMKSVRLRGTPEKSYYVGPLARLNVNASFSTPKAAGLLTTFKGNGVTRNSAVDNIEARLIEMVFCAERISAIVLQSKDTAELSVPVTITEGHYVGIVEAPRGILIHDYVADSAGIVRSANLIVATQNNYDAINLALTTTAKHFKPKNDDKLLMGGVEFALRCFDPCLACATHAMGKMPLSIDVCHNGNVVRTISQEVNHGNNHTGR